MRKSLLSLGVLFASITVNAQIRLGLSANYAPSINIYAATNGINSGTYIDYNSIVDHKTNYSFIHDYGLGMYLNISSTWQTGMRYQRFRIGERLSSQVTKMRLEVHSVHNACDIFSSHSVFNSHKGKYSVFSTYGLCGVFDSRHMKSHFYTDLPNSDTSYSQAIWGANYVSKHGINLLFLGEAMVVRHITHNFSISLSASCRIGARSIRTDLATFRRDLYGTIPSTLNAGNITTINSGTKFSTLVQLMYTFD
ncbi:MAG: hypothetical protein RL660_856 [Bacteroidota bacterium]|jgi:hypothetical protein